ncbi:ABC transporter permease [Haloplanus halophilus]|uniref:ABC transporter permease n=1 Tax=Haloplanus halophilus TaxID=2949993 RepID=UPI00203F5EC0|nr:ABC transporter permease [Haloplanus sp. GDY1]
MSRSRRIGATFVAAFRAFLRRRTAVFFTFFFPVLLILIFGALVGTRPTGGGLFARDPAYYLPGYLGVVVVFTPLSRVGSTIARHRDGNRFEKLATTPLRRWEWLLAHTLVNVVLIGLAALLLFALVLVVTGAAVVVGPALLSLVPLVVLGVALFCGLGSILGRIASSQDGVIAASNSVALPVWMLSETFVPPSMLPAWFRPVTAFSPLTYFSRGVRTAAGGGDPTGSLAVLAVLAALFFLVGAVAVPNTE